MGPVLAGQVMGRVGNTGLFLFVAVIALGVALAAWQMRRESVAPEDQEPFVVMARTTPVASELDPRYDEEAAREAAEQQARADAETAAAELWDEVVVAEAEAEAEADAATKPTATGDAGPRTATRTRPRRHAATDPSDQGEEQHRHHDDGGDPAHTAIIRRERRVLAW